MTELQRLLLAYDGHRTAGRACALATVVHVEGSAYRSPGARMLVTGDGELTGAISGGCLEGDAARRARQAIVRGTPVVVTYDTTDDEDNYGMGTGCQGIIHLLLEPLNLDDPHNPLELLRAATRRDEPAVLATVFGSCATERTRLGERLLLTAHGVVSDNLSVSEDLAYTIRQQAEYTLSTGQSAVLHYHTATEPLRVFLEVVLPPLRLTIYGAGNDVQPVVRLAAALGWRVRVVDGRPHLPTAARFPEADSVAVLPLAEVGSQTATSEFALLMTHNAPYDLAVLRHLLRTTTPYIGLLGPRKKADRLLEDLREETGQPLDDTLNGRLHSPVGLNLGAENPEEIALAIIAEIRAVQAGRPAGFLRNADGPIHRRAAAVDRVAGTAPGVLITDAVCAL